ncbi:hypothetical protein Patl1_10956 [Pistacia atlantica]|uniref:Uncharacterized protein n=1 Tax=Pistacia atlantica TaxID=434234 RepID=A0ACC1A7R2_9ROSI|nr:hypothetical protein Patl1_10956 [Pistacia atlantica]
MSNLNDMEVVGEDSILEKKLVGNGSDEVSNESNLPEKSFEVEINGNGPCSCAGKRIIMGEKKVVRVGLEKGMVLSRVDGSGPWEIWSVGPEVGLDSRILVACMKLNKVSPRFIPMWIKLNDIPFDMWSPRGLSHIAIEVDASRKMSEVVRVHMPSEGVDERPSVLLGWIINGSLPNVGYEECSAIRMKDARSNRRWVLMAIQ